jgi:hypothetical protein
VEPRRRPNVVSGFYYPLKAPPSRLNVKVIVERDHEYLDVNPLVYPRGHLLGVCVQHAYEHRKLFREIPLIFLFLRTPEGMVSWLLHLGHVLWWLTDDSIFWLVHEVLHVYIELVWELDALAIFLQLGDIHVLGPSWEHDLDGRDVVMLGYGFYVQLIFPCPCVMNQCVDLLFQQLRHPIPELALVPRAPLDVVGRDS